MQKFEGKKIFDCSGLQTFFYFLKKQLCLTQINSNRLTPEPSSSSFKHLSQQVQSSSPTPKGWHLSEFLRPKLNSADNLFF